MWQIRYLSSSSGPHKNFWYVVYCFNVSHCIHNRAYICIMMPLTCWSPLELCLRLSDGCFAVADWTDSESNGGSNCWNIIKIRVNTHHILGRAGGQGGLGPPNFWDNVKNALLFVMVACHLRNLHDTHDSVLVSLKFESNARGESRALEGRYISSQSPSRAKDWDEGIAERNGREK